jgi:hypothetical protein
VFTKPFDKGFVKEEFSKRIAWSPKDFDLEDAKLRITVDQPATSGADLQVSVNGKRVETIRWEAFDTDEKQANIDIISELANGVNDISFLYNAPNHVLQVAEVQISAVIRMTFRQLSLDSDDDTPASTGGTRDSKFFEKVANAIKDNLKTIVVLGVVAGVVTAVLTYANKIGGLGKITRYANFIRR